ncbi:MAG: hypothetical protein E7256_00270 [Lachnospiraceae bacterium]|nr:hypothetical protein [Lachnospiraceae bacterium]
MKHLHILKQLAADRFKDLTGRIAKRLPKDASRKKLAYAGFGAAAVLAILLISSTVSVSRKNSEESPTSSSVQSRATIPVETALIPNEEAAKEDSFFIEDEELEADLTTLISDYLNAKLTLDSETIESLIISDAEINYKKLSRKVEYIESYENIKTYITKGFKGIDYIVYVTYEVKFPMTSANAPSLEEFYVKETDGVYKLYMNTLSETVSSYVLERRNHEEVQNLISITTESLANALKSDSNLLDIYNSFTSSSN